jgi:hypothetical protein
MVRANSPDYGPMGALRVERVSKPDGRYVLYYTWPDRPAEAGSSAAGTAQDGSKSSGRPADAPGQPATRRLQTPDTSGRNV